MGNPIEVHQYRILQSYFDGKLLDHLHGDFNADLNSEGTYTSW